MITGISNRTDKAESLYHLSHPQRRILYSEELYPHTTMQSVMYSFVLRGTFSPALLREAIHLVVRHTEGFQLRLIREGYEINQYIHPYEETEIPYHDFSGEDVGLERWLSQQTQTPIPLHNACLYRFAIYRDAEANVCIFLNAHHIVMDGDSRRILIAQILEAYRCLEAQTEFVPFNGSYLALVDREEAYKGTAAFDADRSFWLNQYQNFAPHTRLFRHHSGVESAKSSRKRYVFPAETVAQLTALGEQLKSSLFRLFLGLSYVLFHRIGQKDQLVVGTAVNNRSDAAEKDAVGMFVNMLPIHLKGRGGTSFRDLVSQFKATIRENLGRQAYPYDRMIRDIRETTGSQAVSELFDLVLNYQQLTYPASVQRVDWHHSGYDNYPLLLNLTKDPTNESLILEIDYRHTMFMEMEMDLLFLAYQHLIEQVSEEPARTLASLEPYSEAVRQRLEASPSLIPYPKTVAHPILAYCASKYYASVSRTQNDLRLILHQKELEKAFWSEVFPVHQRSFFPATKASQSGSLFAQYEGSFSQSVAQKLVQTSNESDQRLHLLLSASVLWLLHKYAAAPELAIGTTLLGQERSQNLINTCLPIYAGFEEEDTFKSLLLRVVRNVNQAMAHQNYPIADFLQALPAPAHGQSSRVFDVKVYLENIQPTEFAEYAAAGLCFYFQREREEIRCRIDYDSQLVDRNTVDKLWQNLCFIGETISQDIQTHIQGLALPHFNRYRFCLAGENPVVSSCAEQLLQRNHDIACLISHHPGIQQFAREHQLLCLSPDDPDVPSQLAAVGYDYFLNLEDQNQELPFQAQGKILKYHDSLLPAYPGYYATTRAILDKNVVHGITWYLTDETHSSQEICKQVSFELGPQETSYSLNLKCIGQVIEAFADLLTDFESNQREGETVRINAAQFQDRNCVPFAAGLVSFDAPADQISAMVRALNFEPNDNPLSTAKIKIEDQLFIPGELTILPEASAEAPGTICLIEPDYIVVATATFDVQIRGYQSLTGGDIADLFLYEGMDLQMAPEKLGQIDQLNRSVAPYEDFWLESFAGIQPISLGLPSLPENGNSANGGKYVSVNLPVSESIAALDPDRYADQVLLLFAAFVYRISGTSAFAFNYKDPALTSFVQGYTQLFAESVPLKIVAEKSWNFETFCQHLRPQLSTLRAAGSFPKDLFHRHHALQAQYPHAQAFSNIGISLTEAAFDSVPVDEKDYLHLLIHTQDREVQLRYGARHLQASAAEQLARQLEVFAQSVWNEPTSPLSCLPVQSKPEQDQILLGFNDSEAGFSEDKTLSQLFEEAVVLHRNRTALAYRERQLSYAELNQLSNQVAHTLIEQGQKRGDPVAILTKRSPEMIAAIMGVMKAGGVYIPIDLGQPPNRIYQILQSTQAGYAIVYEIELEVLLELHRRNPQVHTMLNLGEGSAQAYDTAIPLLPLSEILNRSTINPAPIAEPDDIAYVIHTSGSTGTPKGVVVKHRSVINVIEWVNQRYGVSPADKLLFVTSIGFDLSVYDIFGILATGASLQIADKSEIQDPRVLAQLIAQYEITIWDSTPGTLNQLVPYLEELAPQAQQFRLAMLSGDWIPLSLPPALQDLFPNIHVLSMGGATEATIWSNYFDVYALEPEWKSVPYGKPIQNCKYYIFDTQMNVCPVHVEGDLYIGGICVTEGYLNQPALTADRFIENPHFPGERIYKTGDRARWFSDGNMEFLGRVDHQIKLRGFRIELGEIESQMLKFSGIKVAIVIVKSFGENDKRLIAYFTANEPIGPAAVKAHLQDSLPPYMVPAQVIQLATIPITPIGKVDRKALMALEGPQAKKESSKYTLLSERGKRIVAIWKEALGVSTLQLEDNFFELGGHSFLVIQVSNMMQTAFGKEPRFVHFTNRNLGEFIAVYEAELV